MSDRCTLETDDRLDDRAAGISEAQRILIITAATGELSRLWGPRTGTPDPEGPGAWPAVPRACAIETHRTRGYAMREAVSRVASMASVPLAGTSRRLRLVVLALFVVVIVACAVLAVAAYVLPVGRRRRATLTSRLLTRT
jgi:hypothetical protein